MVDVDPEGAVPSADPAGTDTETGARTGAGATMSAATSGTGDAGQPEGAAGNGGGGGVTEYLFFFLGLLPTLVAAVRVYLIAHGDRSTMLTLLRTLNVSALMLDTFIRFIGVMGMAVTAFVFIRLLREPRAATPPSWLHRMVSAHRQAALLVLSGAFVVFLGSSYWEEFWDYDNRTSPGPEDLTKVAGWLMSLYLVRACCVSLWRRLAVPRLPAADSLPSDRWARALLPSRPEAAPSARRAWIPARGAATYTLLPAAVLMMWSLLSSSENRMWLPAQVITLDKVPAVMTYGDGKKIAYDSSYPSLNGATAHGFSFVGYVLDDNGTTETVLASNGVVVTVESRSVTGRAACQYERTADNTEDKPFIDRIFGSGDKWRPAAPCEDLLRQVLGE